MIIDISQYNTVVDWKKLKESVDGIIFRIGYRGWGKRGNLVLDKCFHAYVSKCTELSIPYGIYFVTQATTITEILAECAFISEYDNILNPTLGIWIDSEYSTEPNRKGRGDLINRSTRTKLINDFCRYFEEKNIPCGLYCSDSWLDDMLIYNELTCKKFWIAKYGKNNGKKNGCPKHIYDLWQYTSKGKVDGINGYVDLNCCIEKSSYLPTIRGYSGNSIVRGLELFGYDSSFEARKNYAKMLGIEGYKGTAEQNLLMIKLLK